MQYKYLEHTADAKFVSFGKTLPEVFENAVKAVSGIIVENPDKIEAEETREIVVSAVDEESLLVDFLNEVLYLLEVKDFIPKECEIEMFNHSLKAVLRGDKIQNYKTITHIKSITYNELEIRKTKKGYEAQVVADI